ncbi:MAG: LPS export ABC transporter permease LptG [Gammaproteobacteria bacterium]|nr:LPS export ABC transporter permease LptG [Gammaproteobacteria bacterium]
MASKLNIHLIKAILSSTLLVMLSLMSIEFLVRLITDVDHLGDKDFTFITLLTISFAFMPIKLFYLLPISIIIGSLLGLGKLQSSNEMTIMIVSGFSKIRIICIGGLVSLILGTSVFLIIESVGYSLNNYATELRASSLGRAVRRAENTGAWLVDGNNFLNVGGINSHGVVKDISIFSFDNNMTLNTITTAESAQTAPKKWLLSNTFVKEIQDNKIETSSPKTLEWNNHIDNDLLKILIYDPEKLSINELFRYIQYQDANNVKSTNYMLIFWQRILMPLSCFVMFLLALPFVFGTNRDSGQGRRLFTGLLLGLVYNVFSSSISNIVLLTGLPVILGALLPIVIFTMVALILLQLRKGF